MIVHCCSSYSSEIHHYLVAMDIRTKLLTIDGKNNFRSLPDLVEVCNFHRLEFYIVSICQFALPCSPLGWEVVKMHSLRISVLMSNDSLFTHIRIVLGIFFRMPIVWWKFVYPFFVMLAD